MGYLHTCYRITDIDRSVAFYEALGFAEVRRKPIGDDAINVFMNMADDGDEPRLELTWNRDQEGPYDLGTGYNHIAISTSDIEARLEQLGEQGIEPEKPPYRVGGKPDGTLICFVRDPDDYRVELIQR